MARHVFFSPHSDDVVWSVGGLIWSLVKGGDSVLIATVFAEGEGADRRRGEDRQAAAILGAKLAWANLPEAKMRAPDMPTLAPKGFAAPPLDSDLCRRLQDFSEHLCRNNDYIYLPRANRSHIDHLVLHKTLKDRPGVSAYYEEFPYWPARITDGADKEKLPVLFEPWLTAALKYKSQVIELFGSQEIFRERLEAFARRGAPQHNDYGVVLWRPRARK